MPLQAVTLKDLTIDDEGSFRGIALYGALKKRLRDDEYQFLIPARGTELSWDRAVALNLTFWSGEDAGDVLCDDHVAADVVTHVAWHHLATRFLAPKEGGRLSTDALFLGESIASAFDLYLLGRLLLAAPDSEFVSSQVPLLREAAEVAGMGEEEFTRLLHQVAQEPERSFETLRALLFDVGTQLMLCANPQTAQRVFERCADHVFYPLLHHYALSTWLLYARAYGTSPTAEDPSRAVDQALRAASDPVEWLTRHWVDVAEAAPPKAKPR